MLVDYIDGRYIAKCSFEERHAPAVAGFKFDSAIKRWVTHNSGIALTLGVHVLTDRARRSIGTLDGALPVPEGLEYLPFQEDGIRWGISHHASLIADQPGLGKGHPVGTPILTPQGYRPLGDLNVGDYVIGYDGRPVLVTAIYPRGVIPVYRITFEDGGATTCDGDHLWSLDLGGEEFVTLDTLALAARLDRERGLAIPVMMAPSAASPMAYAVAPRRAGLDAAFQFGIGRRRARRTPFGATTFVTDFSPYAQGAPHQRIEFLSAIVRAIGTVRGGSVLLRLRNRPGAAKMAQVLQDIVQRLGGLLAQSRRHTTIDCTLRLPQEILWPVLGYPRGRPMRFKRRWRGISEAPLVRRITSIIPAGRDDVRCLSVRGFGNLYVAEHAIVTHNTVQAIGTCNAIPDLTNALIISPASLRKNWFKEWNRWTTHPNLSIDVAYGSNFPRSNVVIINPDILDRHRDALRQREWRIVIPDEAHYYMNETARRTRALYGGFEKITNERGKKVPSRIIPIPRRQLLLLSGTPIPNKISNFWTTVRACDPLGLGRDEKEFCKRYAGGYEDLFAGFVKDGETNPAVLAELNALSKSRFMIRRLKMDVLQDLPEKIRQIVPLPADGLKKAQAAEKEALLDLLDAYEQMVGIRKNMSDADLIDAVMKISPTTWEKYAKTQEEGAGSVELPLTRLARARQDLALAKLPMVIEYVQNLLDSDEKVVVFAYHKAVIEALLAHFSDKVGTACVYGKTPMDSQIPGRDRQAQQDKFQNDESCRLFIGQYTAAGTGFTLTRACHNVFAELVWVPHELLQAEDRIHRIGSEIWDTVWCHHLCVQGTLDDTFIAKLVEKMRIIELALD